MPERNSRDDNVHRRVFIVTGPTSGIGRRTAFELAKHGTVVLVGRDRKRLQEAQQIIERSGGRAIPVVCDLSDLTSVEHAAAEIISLRLPIAGLLNNAGVMPTRASKNAQGWDLAFATNHLGPFALTASLIPALPDGANVLFVCSAVEDPERKPAVAAGFRGARYISAEASARGEWEPGGATQPGFDAYATSKQCNLATALAFARQTPRLNFNAIEPGFNPTTGLGRDARGFAAIMAKFIVPVLVPILVPFVKILSTPRRAARVITNILLDKSGQTGIYYDEGGRPMRGSTQVHDHKFQDRVVAETRDMLTKHSTRNPHIVINSN